MKISNQGFIQMLQLSLLSPTSSEGVYFLYLWDDLKYYCGPKGGFDDSDLEGVYIELNSEQLNLLPKITCTKGSCSAGAISKILEYFETAIMLKVSKDKQCVKAAQVLGSNVALEHLSMGFEESSPIRIIKESGKPFHGVYSPLVPFKDKLESLGVNTHNLWITAVPIIRDGVFEGVLMGMSHDVDYGLDIIDIFNSCADEVDLAA